jgi:meso-butanediol dehydrogenase / (S,S)-butanediol dehydrogenase / diacetyl reductase
MQEFVGKVAVVTATTGIGRAIARRFAGGGAKIVCCGIDKPGNDELAEQSGSADFKVEYCDVADPAFVQAVVKKTVATFGGLDIIANAAAVHPFGSTIDTDPDTWNRCMAVNVGGIYLMAHFGIPEMKKRGGGAIVNLASVQAYACQPNVAAYATSKAAILSLTRSMALDHAADKIRVNSISPGSIHTPLLEYSANHFYPGQPVDEVIAKFGAAHPLGRVGKPEEVAELAAFLASDRSSFCTGGDYRIDGGLLAGIAVK